MASDDGAWDCSLLGSDNGWAAAGASLGGVIGSSLGGLLGSVLGSALGGLLGSSLG